MRRGRARRHAPAVVAQPQVCGPCGDRFGTVAELQAHAAACWAIRDRAPRPELSRAIVELTARLAGDGALSVQYAILRLSRELNPDQRVRLAFLVDEISTAIDQRQPGAAS